MRRRPAATDTSIGMGGVALPRWLRAYETVSVLVQRRATSLYQLHLAVLGLAALFAVLTVSTVGMTRDTVAVLALIVGLAANLLLLRGGFYTTTVVVFVTIVFASLSVVVYLGETHSPLKLYQLGFAHSLAMILAALASTSVWYAAAVGGASLLTVAHYFVFFVLPAGLQPFQRSIDAYLAVNVLVAGMALAALLLNRQLNQLLSQLLGLNESLEAQVEQRTAELRDSQRRLIEAEKLASVSRVVAGLSHEVNTPLGVGITAQSHLITTLDEARELGASASTNASELGDALDSAGELADLVGRNLRTLEHLIGRLRAVMAQQEMSEPERVRIRDDLDAILHRHESSWHGQSPLACEIIGDPELEATLHASVLWDVVPELIENAALHAFTHEGGKLSVSYRKDGDSVVLVVADNGEGMTEETRQRVFEPFFTTRRSSGRTGLGLHIAYTHIRRAGGSVAVHSARGQGSIFTIRLPTTES